MAERILMKGNEAIAEAAIRAGCKLFFGYPITPQTEISAYMSRHMPKRDGLFLQAESEIAAINMVYGASAAGVRTMTSSSSPGISLKAEGISYLAGADLPAVIVNIQRGGPGLGGIQPSQADYYQATKGLAHGDFHIIVLAPSTVQETADCVYDAFDISDKYRVPVLILSDGMLGQMMEPIEFKDKESTMVEKPWAVDGHHNEREHNVVNSLFLDPKALEDKIHERFSRYEQIKETEVRFEEFMTEDAEIIVVAYGASSRITKSAVVQARENGIKVGLIRPITLWPFPEKVLKSLSEKVNKFLVVEMSMGQMIDDVKLSVNSNCVVEFCGRTGGIIPTPEEVLEKIETLVKAD